MKRTRGCWGTLERLAENLEEAIDNGVDPHQLDDRASALGHSRWPEGLASTKLKSS